MAVTLNSDLCCEHIPWNGQFDDQLLAAWTQLVEAIPGANIFQHPAWMNLACQTGIVNPSQLLRVNNDNRALALVPLQKRTPWTWELPVPVSVEYPPLVVDPSEEAHVWAALVNWMQAQTTIKRISLGLCGDQQRIEQFRQACISHNLVPQVQRGPIYVNIPLTTDWESFLATLGKSTRSKLRRIDTHMQNSDMEFSIEFLTDRTACASALQELIRLYRARWDHQIGGSVFSRKSHAAFYHQFMAHAVAQGYASIPIMRAKGQTLAVGSVFHRPGQEKAYFHFIACDANVLPNHWLNAPGITLVSHVIRWATARGAKVLGMGAGSNQYKMMLGGQEEQLWELIVARSPLADALIPKLDFTVHALQRMPVHLWQAVRRMGRRNSAKSSGE